MTEDLSELDKLKNAALLIEEMSQGYLRMCLGALGNIHIRPSGDAYIGIEVREQPNLALERCEITFDAHVRRMGTAMNSSDLRTLLKETNQAYALLMALEMREYQPSMDDMAVFRDFLALRQELSHQNPNSYCSDSGSLVEQTPAEQTGLNLGQIF